MQRQHGELVPIGDALSGMAGPVQTIRDNSPQARRGFTVADQVDRLVCASEADPDRGFMARTMALCSLPRSKPRQPASVQARQRSLHAHHDSHRKLQAPLRKPAATTHGLDLDRSDDNQSRILVLGDSLSDFMRTLGVYSSSGGKYTRLRNQMRRPL